LSQYTTLFVMYVYIVYHVVCMMMIIQFSIIIRDK